VAAAAAAQEAQWIWSPEHVKGSVPQSSCHFRRQFVVSAPQGGEITLVADDEYELYVNGRRVGSGDARNKPDVYQLDEFLTRGNNLIAVKVTNTQGSTAGLAARLRVNDQSRGGLTIVTDNKWLTNLRPLPFWYTTMYSDSRWVEARVTGRWKEAVAKGPAPKQSDPAKPATVAAQGRLPLPAPPEEATRQPEPEDAVELPAPETKPDTGPAPPKKSQPPPEQLVKVLPDFQVERLLDDQETHSLLAMTFNEFGHLIASRENGGLILVYDSDRNGDLDRVREYCDLVKNCQGLLCLNGDVYVTGEGPEGLGLYRLMDKNRDGKLEESQTMLKFRGKGGEFGPHRLALGNDGWLYLALGNQAQPELPYDPRSPHRNYYEADLVQPRYEDPLGHEPAGKAPGSVILRTDLKGEKVQLVAGGLRNAQAVAFNAAGELFTVDQGAQFEVGTPWHRPARVQHVIPGGEFGWRSGWAKWPDYFVDSLPCTMDLGRLMPTAAVFYQHHLFPEKFQDALLIADRASGRILTVSLKPHGSSYQAVAEVLLEGESLSISDLDVAPDGCLYFVTGGQGAAGGVYRIKWLGKPGPGATDLGRGLSAVIRQPQLTSAWSRQQVAAIKTHLGQDWDRLLRGVALSSANPWRYRTRSLELMQWYGPTPEDALLVKLCSDDSMEVRATAAEMLGWRPNQETQAALGKLLDDAEAVVRRKACEAMVRAGASVPHAQLLRLLKSEDRYEAWAARRLLETLPADQWRDELLGSDQARLVLQSSLALLIAHPDKDQASRVLERLTTLMGGYLSDRDFVDLLRVVQVALVRGAVPVDEAVHLRELLANEYPSQDQTINRELVRLLTHLQDTAVVNRYLEQLQSAAVPDPDKLHLAMHLRFLEHGWTTAQRTQVLEFFEEAQKRSGGHSYRAYVAAVSRDFARNMTEEEARHILTEGTRWPSAAVGALYKLPQRVDDELLATLQQLNDQLADATDLPRMRLKVGIVAVLARGGDPQCLTYLRQLWEADPERRPAIAMGLAQWPSEENWTYLVRSLPVLEGDAAREVIVKLKSVQLAPDEAEFFRAVILCGLKLGGAGAEDAVSLLEYWTDTKTKAQGDWQARLAAWQAWYAEKWREAPEAVLAEVREPSKWKLPELLHKLAEDDVTPGSAARGATVFEKAQCAKCHRLGDLGTAAGVDLTHLWRRAMRKEIVESVLYPSHVVVDQYAQKVVVTARGRIYVGVVSVGATGDLTVHQADGSEVTVPKDEVDEVHARRTSDMPSNLLDTLSAQEVADLFLFLGSRPDAVFTKRDDGTLRR
jgi:putative heme-binding domain-containing protein